MLFYSAETALGRGGASFLVRWSAAALAVLMVAGFPGGAQGALGPGFEDILWCKASDCMFLETFDGVGSKKAFHECLNVTLHGNDTVPTQKGNTTYEVEVSGNVTSAKAAALNASGWVPNPRGARIDDRQRKPTGSPTNASITVPTNAPATKLRRALNERIRHRSSDGFSH